MNNPTENTGQLVTFQELARRMPVSKRWLRQQLRDGRIPSLKAGNSRLFNLEAVRAALAERAAGADPEGGGEGGGRDG